MKLIKTKFNLLMHYLPWVMLWTSYPECLVTNVFFIDIHTWIIKNYIYMYLEVSLCNKQQTRHMSSYLRNKVSCNLFPRYFVFSFLKKKRHQKRYYSELSIETIYSRWCVTILSLFISCRILTKAGSNNPILQEIMVVIVCFSSQKIVTTFCKF